MNAFVPDNWKEVDKPSFLEFLKGCWDYTMDGWANGIVYLFRWNRERFAIELNDGRILVDPKLLAS